MKDIKFIILMLAIGLGVGIIFPRSAAFFILLILLGSYGYLSLENNDGLTQFKNQIRNAMGSASDTAGSAASKGKDMARGAIKGAKEGTRADEPSR